MSVLLIMILLCNKNAYASNGSIKMNKQKITLSAGSTYKLKVKSISGTKNKSVKYKSDKPQVATVSKKGIITAKKSGKASIVVKSKKNKRIKSTIRVFVKRKPNDYNSVVTEKLVRKSLGVPKDAKVKIEYGDRPCYHEAMDRWRIDVLIIGKGKYKGYSAGAFFDIHYGDTTDGILGWYHY